jgi:hypothetical protein
MPHKTISRKRDGVKIRHASQMSPALNDVTPLRWATNEWYAIAKIAGLKLCEAYRRQHGADFISAMPTNLYGPDNFDLKSSHVSQRSPEKLTKPSSQMRQRSPSGAQARPGASFYMSMMRPMPSFTCSKLIPIANTSMSARAQIFQFSIWRDLSVPSLAFAARS